MELLRKFYRKEIKPELDYLFLALVVLFFTILRLPSLIEPSWYGDEGIYQVIGRALNSGRMLYSGIWDNKPPLLYLGYAFFDGELFYIRLASLVFGALAIIVFFFIARNLFLPRTLPVYISTFAFSFLFGIPLLEGNIANAENFMLFPILLSFFIIIRLKKNSSLVLPVLAGLLLSFAFLIKIVAVFDLIAFLYILFLLRYAGGSGIATKKITYSKLIKLTKVLKQELVIVISFLVPIFLTSLYFLQKGIFPDFFRAAFSQNVGYVGYWNHLEFVFGSQTVAIPQGILGIKILFLLLILAAIFYMRKKMSRVTILVYVWLALSLFNAFFSGRPYIHYMLVVLPAICFFFGYLFTPMKERMRVFHVTVLIIVVALLRNNFWIYEKVIPYYINYMEFIQEDKNVTSYQAFFDRITPRDYEVARFIELHTDPLENVFLISDSAQIYYLSDKLPPGRYAVSYHVTFYENGIEETKQDFEKSDPKYIIVTKEGGLERYFWQNYELRYVLDGAVIYERKF